MSKIRRNDPCPCGSGKKYKKCCLHKSELFIQYTESGIPPEVIKIFEERKQQEDMRIMQYGEVRPIIHADYNGYKFVAVGNELHYSKNIKTFPDFLIRYTSTVLGPDWCNDEIKKPWDEKHQILKWYDGMCHFQQKQIKQENGLYCAIPNGDFAALIHLAYDLYVLKHHSLLQNRIINRLKIKDQFQGARYELFATATCIRAGYNIEFEDEQDVTKKHPEFKAFHKDTGQVICLEAKSRHRTGVLDFHFGKPPTEEADLTRLLKTALEKPHEFPLVIYIDINMPPIIKPDYEDKLKRELMDTIDKISTGINKDPFNLIIFTNHPHYYAAPDENDPLAHAFMVYSNNPLVEPQYPQAIMDIYNAAHQYKNIPNFFPDDF